MSSRFRIPWFLWGRRESEHRSLPLTLSEDLEFAVAKFAEAKAELGL